MSNGNCANCGKCGTCGGCGKSLTVTGRELELLRLLGQIPFLPVARKKEDMIPVFSQDPGQETSAALQCLEIKGLISIDYDSPLTGTDPAEYGNLPVRGSMALTARGQWVLETAEIQGIEGEQEETCAE